MVLDIINVCDFCMSAKFHEEKIYFTALEKK
jgi:hypothetical protein